MSQNGYGERPVSYAQWNIMRAWEYFSQRAVLRNRTLISVPPPVMVLLTILSVQLGAALAKGLFISVGSTGTVLLRQGFAALVLILFWRPRLRGYSRSDYIAVLLFGLVIACMNAAFYASIARIPLGVATTIEFTGPLGISFIASRRRQDILWAVLAATGVILLAPIGNFAFDPLGIGLALLAGLFWAAYVLLNVKVGRAFPGGNGLALGMSIAALAMLPFGIASGGLAMLHPKILLLGIAVAMLSTVIPFSLELETLRRLPPRIYGILMSLEPAIAALIGFVLLKETVSLRALIALALIVVASGGSSFFQQQNPTRDPL